MICISNAGGLIRICTREYNPENIRRATVVPRLANLLAHTRAYDIRNHSSHQYIYTNTDAQAFMQRPVHPSYGRVKQNVDGCFVWMGLDE